MKQVYVYSHLGGEEILLVKYPAINDEINAVIESIPNPGRGKVSREKTKGSSSSPPQPYDPYSLTSSIRRQ